MKYEEALAIALLAAFATALLGWPLQFWIAWLQRRNEKARYVREKLQERYSELIALAVSEFKRAQSEEAAIQLGLPGWQEAVASLKQRRQSLCLDLHRVSLQIRLLESDESLRSKVEAIAKGQPWMPPNWGQENYNQQLAQFKVDIAAYEKMLTELTDDLLEKRSEKQWVR